MKEKTLQNCKFVKMILMISVVLGHSMAFWSGNWFIGEPADKSSGLKYIYLWINSFHTYSFVIVSGYIFAYKKLGGGV